LFAREIVKTLVICFSYHHKNTAKIALVFASALNAEIKTPPEVNPNGLSEYDLIGFGSGIYFRKHHKSLLDLADKLPQVTNKKAFIFSTSGQTGTTPKFHKKLREKLQSKGFNIVGEFNCAGLDTYGLMKIVRGLNKEHPNKDDIKQAEAFAQSLNQPAKA
jgi:flavodoxin